MPKLNARYLLPRPVPPATGRGGLSLPTRGLRFVEEFLRVAAAGVVAMLAGFGLGTLICLMRGGI